MEKRILSKINDTLYIELINKNEILLAVGRMKLSLSHKELFTFNELTETCIEYLNSVDGGENEKYHVAKEQFEIFKMEKGHFHVKFLNITITMCGHAFLNLWSLCNAAVIKLYDLNPIPQDVEELLSIIYNDVFKE